MHTSALRSVAHYDYIAVDLLPYCAGDKTIYCLLLPKLAKYSVTIATAELAFECSPNGCVNTALSPTVRQSRICYLNTPSLN